jgi:hypothetical protein
MKKFFAVLIAVIFLAACGGGGGGGGNESQGGEKILSITKIEDYGYASLYEIVVDFSSLPVGTKVVNGQSAPNSAWIDYPVQNPGNLFVTWIDGEFFEFTYCVDGQSGRVCVEPTGDYVYPPDAPAGEKHFRVRLGEAEICSEKNINDALIIGVHKLTANTHRIYLDFTKLPIANYQSLFVKGQSAPDSAWVNYHVVDSHPCYYFDLSWPENSNLPFEFSYGVVMKNGEERWVDPTVSGYLYLDHLAIYL